MPEYGRAVATHRDPDHLDVFMRTPEGTLLHLWGRDGDADPFDNAVDLGGDLESEPVAVRRFPAGMDVFTLSTRLSIMHWSWDVTTQRWSEPEDLPGIVATVPSAVADDETLYVFAKSVDGPIRWWIKSGSAAWEAKGLLHSSSENLAVSDPVAVRRGPGVIDVYHYAKPPDSDEIVVTVVAVSNANGVIEVAEHSLRTGVFSFDPTHPITAFSWLPNRQDVYVRATQGRLVHYAKGNLAIAAETDEELWYGPESIAHDAWPLGYDPIAISREAGAADIFFHDQAGTLHRWTWVGGNIREWKPKGTVDGLFKSTPVAVARDHDTIELVLRNNFHEVTVWRWFAQSDQWDVTKTWKASLFKPDPPQDPLAGSTDDDRPDFLVIRPDDHVLLGVTAPDHFVNQDGPPTLVLPEGGRVVVTLPPQHIAEEVSRPNDNPPGATWGALLSGPSRVALNGVPTAFLTAGGMLAALDEKPVDENEDASAIELPRGLIVAPEPPEGEREVVVRHPTTPVGRRETFGVWRTRLGTSAGDGGLQIKGVRAGRDENFAVALPKGYRVLIAEQRQQLASAERLELSCLGGTLTASGRWDSFEWDHRAVLGRDQSVRIAVKGVLYPLGHRAVWVELTERSKNEDIAVLRKTNTLYITEPLVRPGAGAPTEVRSALPFSEVEIKTREYRDLDEPHWTTFRRETEDLEVLATKRDANNQTMEDIHNSLFPHLPHLPISITEDLAHTDESAVDYLKFFMGRQRYQWMIDTLIEEGQDHVDINTYFEPKNHGAPVEFAVRCRAENGDVHFALPLFFVADLALTDEIRESFVTLADPRVAAAVQKDYGAARGGVVELPGVPIDLTPAAPKSVTDASGKPVPTQTTIHEVRRLNIVGNHFGSGYLPSLGALGGGPDAWAADVGVPTIRTLVGEDPTARVAFTEHYLSGAAATIPLEIKGKVVDAAQDALEQLDIDFTAIKDRAGGLAAPNMVVNQFSQAYGLINADPNELLTAGASLLGFDLRDLVKNISEPPQLKTVTHDGVPNEITMLWDKVPLPAPDDSSQQMFIPEDDSTVTIRVVSAPDNNNTHCEVTNFRLRMPPGDETQALIELTFARAVFDQHNGQPPDVTVGITDFKFVGRLELLEALREKLVGFNDFPVKIEPAKDKVVARYSQALPAVSAMSFMMTNLLFSAALTVPFNKEPVAFELGFASRQRPFTLTVLMFGGGGYVDLEMTYTGLRRLEISLQFGAAIGMNFGVGHAEVHAFGGIRYALVSRSAKLTGYIHLGGSLDVLGLVSIAVELRVELEYVFDKKQLVGRAKVVIDIDVTLYSDSFELDSGEWVIAGGSEAHHVAGPAVGQGLPRPVERVAPFDAASEAEDPGLRAWQEYRRAFA